MPADATSATSPSVVELQRRVDELTAALHARDADHEAAVLREAAVAEVLQVINSSPGDVGPVFEAILSRAMRLCDASFGTLATYEGQRLRTAATRGVPEAFARFRLSNPPSYGPGTGPGQLIAGEDFVHDIDAADSDAYRQGDPNRRAIVDLGGARTILNVALRKNGALLGSISIYRQEVRAFSDEQITLIRNFAAQAVLAIENARVLTEMREALEQQTATAEILTVISQSPTDVTPVLTAVAKAATKFCGAIDAQVVVCEGDEWVVAAHDGPIDPVVGRRALTRETAPGRAIIDGNTIQIVDLQAVDGDEFPEARELGARLGFRSALAAPLLRDHIPIGAIALRRREAGAFAPRQIELLKTFAAQAVIAIENVRLFTELGEALRRQTATAEILRVINASPGVLEPVFDAILAEAHDLCGATQGSLQLYDGEQFRAVATRGMDPALAAFLRGGYRPTRTTDTSHGRSVQFADAAEMARQYPHEESWRAAAELGRLRTLLAVPLVKDGRFLGRIMAGRQEVRLFSDKEIALLEGFAAQAVIAMENARLLTEQREALEQQTATAEVLEVINAWPGNVQPVFEAMLERASRLCAAPFSQLAVYDGEFFRFVASHGEASYNEQMPRGPLEPSAGLTWLRLVSGEDVVHIPDLAASEFYRSGHVAARRIVDLGGGRSLLTVALRKEHRLLGALTVYSRERRPFADKQIALLQNFAAQAVVAMENARLITETREALEHQSAMAEVLAVINTSLGDPTPVFETILAKAHTLFGAEIGSLGVFDGKMFKKLARRGYPPDVDDFLSRPYPPLIQHQPLLRGESIHVPDVTTHAWPAGVDVPAFLRWAGDGLRAWLEVPLWKDGRLLGSLSVWRAEPRAFTPREIQLLESFADQAVIAMENARLLGELRESLEQQTATSEVLQVISRSPGELQPVFDAMLDKGMSLCQASFGTLASFDGKVQSVLALRGATDEMRRFFAEPIPIEPQSAVGRLARNNDSILHVLDAREDEAYRAGVPSRVKFVDGTGARTALWVALRKDGRLVGVFIFYRREVRAFNDKQIALLRTFADQAVIAMENARLLSDLRLRTDDLQQSLEYQTAIGEVLTVISRSTFDLAPVLQTLAETALRLCSAEMGFILRREGEAYRVVTSVGATPESAEDALQYHRHQETRLIAVDRGSITGRVALAGAPVQIADITADPEYKLAGASALGRIRTQVGVPLIREGALIGVLVLSRQRVEPFDERQIGLLRTFADQAVIAMENARLLGELRQRTGDLQQSLDYQTATSDVLKVISRSTFDLQPVLDTLSATAARLCTAELSFMTRREGDAFRFVTAVGATPETTRDAIRLKQEVLDQHLFRPGRDTITGRVVAERGVVQIADVASDPEYALTALTTVGKIKTLLGVPLMREGEVVGTMSLARQRIEPFTDKQIELIRTFADQAVIAMENARLLGELRESLDQQTATSEVLRTINRSVVDLGAVLETLIETVARLCRADQAYMFRRQEGLHHLVASHGASDETKAYMLANPFTPDRGNTSGRVLLEKRTIHIPDVLADPDYTYSEGQKIAGFRTMLGLPLMRDEALIGVFVVSRTRVEPFSEKEIALAAGFADQAVIAIENARLFEELRDRQAELRVTFDNMGDGVVMIDGQLRLAAWNRNFQEILDIPDSFLATRPRLEDHLRLLVGRGELGDANAETIVSSYLDRVGRQWSNERTRPDGKVIEVRNNPVPGGGAVLIYSDITERKKAEAEIAAARDAAEAALERQTATAEILKVIASSPTDVQPVLDAVADAAVRFCGAPDATIGLRDGESWLGAAHTGPIQSALGERFALTRETLMGRTIVDAETQHVPDVDALDPVEFSAGRQLQRRMGVRAVLATPLLREGAAIGAISLRRIEPGPFSSQQVELLETFAAQAVIAIENVRLFTELRESLERLKAAQANLIQSEKMASLGQLTAGIAHEIKNPLNFVNNFASLSVDLLDELKEVAGPALAALDEDKRAELEETMELLVGNLRKITEHGKRADGIVRSMLSHSRGGSGDWQPSDINALVEEALNLAYHGARAQDQEFNVTLERDLDRSGEPIDVVPQDVTRVFLNLFGNGFYAANKRRTMVREAGFRPTIKVTTRDLGELVEVRVRDNGTGIPPDVREKLFQPFFTTKPTGEGTGLGLSISYDIVTQQHGGTIAVESEPGSFTEFTVRLPRTPRVTPAGRAR